MIHPLVPSGKTKHNYGKSPFLMGKSPLLMEHIRDGFATKLPASNIDIQEPVEGKDLLALLKEKAFRRTSQLAAKLITSYGKPHKPWEYTGNHTYNDIQIIL